MSRRGRTGHFRDPDVRTEAEGTVARVPAVMPSPRGESRAERPIGASTLPERKVPRPTRGAWVAVERASRGAGRVTAPDVPAHMMTWSPLFRTAPTRAWAVRR